MAVIDSQKLFGLIVTVARVLSLIPQPPKGFGTSALAVGVLPGSQNKSPSQIPGLSFHISVHGRRILKRIGYVVSVVLWGTTP
jgi:hypothetical protein